MARLDLGAGLIHDERGEIADASLDEGVKGLSVDQPASSG